MSLTRTSWAVRPAARWRPSDSPWPFIVDYPGQSPVGNADVAGALPGMDRVHWTRAAGTFAVWLSVAGSVVYVTRSIGNVRNIRGRREG